MLFYASEEKRNKQTNAMIAIAIEIEIETKYCVVVFFRIHFFF